MTSAGRMIYVMREYCACAVCNMEQAIVSGITDSQ